MNIIPALFLLTVEKHSDRIAVMRKMLREYLK